MKAEGSAQERMIDVRQSHRVKLMIATGVSLAL
jgi:hypothetical protein